MRGHAGANCQSSSTDGRRQNGCFCRGNGPLTRLSTRFSAASSTGSIARRLSVDSISLSNCSLFISLILINHTAERAAQILLAAHQQGLNRRYRRVEDFSNLRIAHALAVGEHDRAALARGQLVDRCCDHALTLVGLSFLGCTRRRIDNVTGSLQPDPRRAPFAVETEIDHHAGEPGTEQREWPPARCIGPHAHERFLRDVLGLRSISEDATGNPEHGRQMTAREHLECPFVATCDPGHERFVAVIHRDAVVAIADARSLQTWPVCLTGGVSESCGGSISGKIPDYHA